MVRGSEGHVGTKPVVFLTLLAKSLERVWSAGYACAFTDDAKKGAEGIKAVPNRVILNDLRELVCHDGRDALEGEEELREVAVRGPFGLGLAPEHRQKFGISQPKLQSRSTPWSKPVLIG